jgi:glutathione S-transferase
MMKLHYYPMSPFSGKVRLMDGNTGGEWLSGVAPEMPPRPIVEPLTGG